MIWNCGVCKNQVYKGQTICLNCGSPIDWVEINKKEQRLWNCGVCGARITKKQRMCFQCGT